MTPAHLVPLFGVGCAASTLISWLATAHPLGSQIAKAIYFILVLIILAGFILDDGVYPHFNMNQMSYYAMLGAIVMAVVIGGGLVWFI